MKLIENVQHDIADACFSVETAIELLQGLSQDSDEGAASLGEIIGNLLRLKQELDGNCKQLAALQDRFEY